MVKHLKDIIIPILIEAYASGEIRPSQYDVPMINPNYKTVLAKSVLGSQNTPSVNEKMEPLEKGIHLHFILPDAFTHSKDGEEFPCVPNRFIVTRIWKENDTNKLKTKCTVVESDFISLESEYNKSITIPFFNDSNGKKKWRYLGRNYPASDITSKNKNAEYLEKLTAVGAGDPVFAAYYPSCRSVFGYHDELLDLSIGKLTKLTYFVMGYFSDKAFDPFSHVRSPSEFDEVLNSLKLSVDLENQACNNAVFYGAIECIEWEGFEKDYSKIPKGKVDIVFANNSVEALSKTIKNTLDGKYKITERMISALQYELYEEIEKIDGNFVVDDQIHYNMFSRLDSSDENPYITISQNIDIESKDEWGKTFSDLKKSGNYIGKLKHQLVSVRNKLFTLWEQYILLYESEGDETETYPTKQEFYNEIEGAIEEIKKIQGEIIDKGKIYQQQFDVFKSSLPYGIDCKKGGNEPFFAVKDPVILMSGKGINRNFAFGEDGRFTSNGTLLCQAATVYANIDKNELLKKCFEEIIYLNKLPQIYGDLLVQTALISAPTLDVIKDIVGEVKITGEISSEIALNKNPLNFITLYMQWSVDYYPTHTNEEDDNTLDDWAFEYGDTGLIYKGDLTPQKLKKYSIEGTIVVTPHAVKTLGNVIERYADIFDKQEKLKKIAEKVKNLSIISQNLSGFSDFFSGFWQALQFPIMGVGDDEKITKDVLENIGKERKSILLNNNLLPLHGGYIKVSKLSLVSSFGLAQELIKDSYYNKSEIDFAETVASDIKDYGMITPSFSDFSRLNAEFVCAKDNEILTSALSGTSPICGIVVPEILNRRLLVFDYDRTYLGFIKTVYREKKPLARWISAPSLENEFDKIEFKDKNFKAFLNNLINGENAFYEFNGLMDNFLDKKCGSELLLWGRPMVLTRMKLNFEFSGEPNFQKKIQDFRKYNTCGVKTIKFNLGFGEFGSLTDGVFGCFDDNDFTKIYPAFGAENPYSTENYLKYSQSLNISNEDNDKYFTLLIEPDLAICIQTGLLPVKKMQLEAVHTNIAKDLPLSIEISPLIGTIPKIGMPILPNDDEKKEYKWCFFEGDEYIINEITIPTASFEETVLMDGFIVKEE